MVRRIQEIVQEDENVTSRQDWMILYQQCNSITQVFHEKLTVTRLVKKSLLSWGPQIHYRRTSTYKLSRKEQVVFMNIAWTNKL
jgi:hypothetical protein